MLVDDFVWTTANSVSSPRQAEMRRRPKTTSAQTATHTDCIVVKTKCKEKT